MKTTTCSSKKITFASPSAVLLLRQAKLRMTKIFMMTKGPVSEFIEYHYRHFNAAALMDAAKGYVTHMDAGGKMMVTLAGAMSTAELGISFAEMIRLDKVAI